MKNRATSEVVVWRTAGFWLALVLALSQLANATRVVLEPGAYATYMGLPLSSADDASWVYVYALRALFLGGFAGYLLVSAQYRVLGSMALVAVVMPVGDFVLVWMADGATATLMRHAVIALALIAAWFSLGRLAKRSAVASP